MSNPIYHSQYTAAQIEDEITNGVPRINPTTKHWEKWDIATSAWVDTGVYADGQSGASAAEAAADRAEAAAGNAEALQAEIYGAYPTATISNQPVASFTDGADGIPVRDLTVNISPVQSGSGDPAPDNVRPISGWTGAKISRTGKNLFDATTAASGYVTASGEINSDDTGRHSPLIPVNAGETYTFSGYANAYTASRRFHAYDANGNWLAQLAARTDSTINQWYALTAEIPAGARYVRLSWRREDTSIMLEKGSARTTYEAFGTVYPVSWQTEAGTVYGGTLTDNGDGTWTLTKTRDVADAATLSWSYSSPRWATNGLSSVIKTNGAKIAEKYKSVSMSASEATSNSIAVDGSGTVYVNDGGTNTSPSGLIVYTLSTAQTYTLTAESVRTLLGQNNIFADCGDIASLTYRADPTLYINGKVNSIMATIAAL